MLTIKSSCAALLSGVALLVSATLTTATAADVRIVAPNAVKEALVEIATRFERDSGHRLVLAWGGSEAIFKRVSEGEAFDLVVTTAAGITRLTTAGRLTAGTKHDIARSAVAVAVRTGLPKPDVSNQAALRQTLLDAKSVAISSGASGRYLEQLFQRLGVFDAIKPKLTQPPSGTQIGDLLARGEVDLGFQQVTELVHAKGFQYVGLLPAEVQNYTVWSVAVHASVQQADAAQAFIRYLSTPAAAEAIRASGMEPM